MKVNIKTVIIIPTYNNEKTIFNVILDIKKFHKDIIVVNDGCTDNTEQILNRIADIIVIQHNKNKGKGAALKSGFKEALARGFTHAITLDSDGQHLAEDIPKILQSIKEYPTSLIIGRRDLTVPNVPEKSNFGLKASNFWIKIFTGKNIPDTQSGYRAYPLLLINQLKLRANSYAFEVEVINKAAWAGIEIISIPINVIYQKPEERVSHFKPSRDITKIIALNFYLLFLRLLPIPMKKLIKKKRQPLLSYLLFFKNNYKTIFTDALREGTSPEVLAFTIGLGVFIGVSPIYGFHTLLAIFIAYRLHLNKFAMLLGINISMPLIAPFLIFSSIQTGHFVIEHSFLPIGGAFIKELKMNLNPEHIFSFMTKYLGYWFMGSFIIGTILAFVIGYTLFFVFKKIEKESKYP